MFEIHAGLVANETILFSRQIGQQTRRALNCAIARLAVMIKEHPVLPEIVDVSLVTSSELDFHSISGVVRNTSQTARPGPAGKTIGIFAPGDMLYGLCRIHSAILDMEEKNVRSAVFRTEAEVLDYMGRPERRFADLEGFDRVGPMPPLDSAACT